MNEALELIGFLLGGEAGSRALLKLAMKTRSRGNFIRLRTSLINAS